MHNFTRNIETANICARNGNETVSVSVFSIAERGRVRFVSVFLENDTTREHENGRKQRNGRVKGRWYLFFPPVLRITYVNCEFQIAIFFIAIAVTRWAVRYGTAVKPRESPLRGVFE